MTKYESNSESNKEKNEYGERKNRTTMNEETKIKYQHSYSRKDVLQIYIRITKQ